MENVMGTTLNMGKSLDRRKSQLHGLTSEGWASTAQELTCSSCTRLRGPHAKLHLSLWKSLTTGFHKDFISSDLPPPRLQVQTSSAQANQGASLQAGASGRSLPPVPAGISPGTTCCVAQAAS